MGAPISDNGISVQKPVLDYLLEGVELPSVEPSSVSAEEWVMLLKEVVQLIKPYLRYVQGFDTIFSPTDKQELNGEIAYSISAQRVLDLEEYPFLMRRNGTLSSTLSGDFACLSRKGNWLRASAYRGKLSSSITELDLLALFIEERSKKREVAGYIYLGHALLLALIRIVDQTVGEKERRLGNLRKLQGKLLPIQDRIRATKD